MEPHLRNRNPRAAGGAALLTAISLLCGCGGGGGGGEGTETQNPQAPPSSSNSSLPPAVVQAQENKTAVSASPVSYTHLDVYKRQVLYEVKTAYGRSIRVTASHSIFVEENGEVCLKRGDDLRLGDRVVAPKSIQLPQSAPKRIDLLRELHGVRDAREQIWVCLLYTSRCV